MFRSLSLFLREGKARKDSGIRSLVLARSSDSSGF
jgi:hypothetical protein